MNTEEELIHKISEIMMHRYERQIADKIIKINQDKQR